LQTSYGTMGDLFSSVDSIYCVDVSSLCKSIACIDVLSTPRSVVHLCKASMGWKIHIICCR